MEISEKKHKIIIKYKQYLKLEKSLSTNTVEAYLTDLEKLIIFLEETGKDIETVRLEDLEAFSAGLHDIGIHPRSQAGFFLVFELFPFLTFGRISGR